MANEVSGFSEAELGRFETFRIIVERLRGEGGCPWDRRQTHGSLKKYLVEESYEVLEAIDQGDLPALSEELGDLWLQIMLHSQIARESGEFSLEDVLRCINTKMIMRHPHVFGDTDITDAEEASLSWQEIKGREKDRSQSLLAGIPGSLPALAYSQTVESRVAAIGFDWENAEDVLDKLVEEIGELKNAATPEEKAHEFGDVLLVLSSVARRMDVDLESALRQANARFTRRFQYIEGYCRDRGLELKGMKLSEMDAIWDEAKREVG
jgi:tetrapyrrole methylase family protein/MazG family protein